MSRAIDPSFVRRTNLIQSGCLPDEGRIYRPQRKKIYLCIMAKLKNIHPGEVLMEEFLLPLEITAYRLSKEISIPQTRLSEILKGRRRITADTALRLSLYFGNSPKFWLGLQDDFDIEEEQSHKGKQLQSIKKYSRKAA